MAISTQHPITTTTTILLTPTPTTRRVLHSNIISDNSFYGMNSVKILDIKEVVSFVRKLNLRKYVSAKQVLVDNRRYLLLRKGINCMNICFLKGKVIEDLNFNYTYNTKK